MCNFSIVSVTSGNGNQGPRTGTGATFNYMYSYKLSHMYACASQAQSTCVALRQMYVQVNFRREALGTVAIGPCSAYFHCIITMHGLGRYDIISLVTDWSMMMSWLPIPQQLCNGLSVALSEGSLQLSACPKMDKQEGSQCPHHSLHLTTAFRLSNLYY